MAKPALIEAAQIAAGLAKNPAAPITIAEAPALAKELTPYVAHLTNNEPAIQSRVTQGSVATIITSLFSMYALYMAGITEGEIWAPPVLAIVGAGWALYGRWVATKPLGA